MPVLTAVQALSYMRLRAQDNDSTIADAAGINGGLTILNKWYSLWTDEIDPRIQSYDGLTGDLATGAFKIQLSTGVWRDFLEVYSRRSSATVAAPMEKRSLADVRRAIYNDQTPGQPSMWAIERTQTATPGDVGKTTLWFWPPASAAVAGISWILDGVMRAVPVPIDVASVTTMDVDPADAYRITLLAASEVAWLLGKDEAFVNGILSEVGDKGSVLVKRWKNIVAPRTPQVPEAV